MTEKQVYAVIMVACVLFASFAIVYACVWAPQTNSIGDELVGEVIEGQFTTEYQSWENLFSYWVDSSGPKKVSLWIDLGEMNDGDTVIIRTRYRLKSGVSTKGFGEDITFSGYNPVHPIKLILDQLPVANHVMVDVYQSAGNTLNITWEIIIEEV